MAMVALNFLSLLFMDQALPMRASVSDKKWHFCLNSRQIKKYFTRSGVWQSTRWFSDSAPMIFS
jgi:hypothetical protein